VTRSIHVVAPAGFDKLDRPTGGNIYDRRVVQGIRDLGRTLVVHAVPGAWPEPDAVALAELARAVEDVPEDSVLLVDGLIASCTPQVLVPTAARVRLVVLVHLPLGDEPTGHVVADAFMQERDVLASAQAIVATSAWTARRLRELYGLPADRLHVAAPGVDRAPLTTPSPDGRRLLCVASLARHKGQDVLVDALGRLAEREWRCTLVGPTDREPDFVAAVRGRIAAAGLGERVEMAGVRTGEALERSYAQADLLVQPSRVEAYGMAVVEALSHGVPVLASDVGGVAEALGVACDGGRPGLLVRGGDSAALAASLWRWFDDAALRQRLRAAAVARRDTLEGWDVTAARIADVLIGP